MSLMHQRQRDMLKQQVNVSLKISSIDSKY